MANAGQECAAAAEREACAKVCDDAAKKAVSRVKKRFPGLVERGAEFSYVPVVLTFGD